MSRAVLAALLVAGCNGAGVGGGDGGANDLSAAFDLTSGDLPQLPCPISSCPTSPGGACVSGTVHHFADDTPLAASETVHVAAWDELDLLMQGSAASQLAHGDFTGGCYAFASLPVPADGAMALTVSDAAGATELVTTGAIVGAAPGHNYHVDLYSLERVQAATWSAQQRVDYAGGAIIGFFFNDGSRAASDDFTFYETAPASGVKWLVAGSPQPPPALAYLGPTRANVDASLTATGTLGIALTTGGGGTLVPSPANWPSMSGAVAPGVVWIARLHAQSGD
jgi:hypothetical protein